MRRLLIFAVLVGLVWTPISDVSACTNFLVTPGASADGSSMVTYAADSHQLYGELYFTTGGIHQSGEMVDVIEWDTGEFLGRIPQVKETFTVVGNMNEHQLTIGETTFTGRKELINPEGMIDYGSLIYITLQRAKTAREAIQVMTGLVEEFGYHSSGEAFSIADPKEVWFMVMIGKGEGSKGALWVARKVPDGYVSAHANHARIGEVPLRDKNTLYSPEIFDFAREKGYFKGNDRDFNFSEAFAPLTWRDARVREARVWSFFRMVAPSKNIEANFVDGTREDVELPLWIKPDRKLTPQDLMKGMRDHFEGTPLDMRKGVGAGPFELPYRWRPLIWEMDGTKYLNERATATQQTAFSFVAQMRANLPDHIGGVFWFSVDDAASTVYVPVYCGVLEPPYNFKVGVGDFHTFSWDSAFWVFNWVANQAYARYKDMIVDIQKVQWELESGFFAQQNQVDAAALAKYKKSPRQAREYLTEYSSDQTKRTVERWKELGIELMMKYMDGNVRDVQGNVTHPTYPEHWYRRIIKERGDHFKFREYQEKE